MEALEIGKEVAESFKMEDEKILNSKYLEIGDKFFAEGYEIGNLILTPRSRKTVGWKALFYVWNPDTQDGKFFFMYPENAKGDIEPFSEVTATKEGMEDWKRFYKRFMELSFYHGDKKARKILLREEKAREEAKQEIKESASVFKVYSGTEG